MAKKRMILIVASVLLFGVIYIFLSQFINAIPSPDIVTNIIKKEESIQAIKLPQNVVISPNSSRQIKVIGLTHDNKEMDITLHPKTKFQIDHISNLVTINDKGEIRVTSQAQTGDEVRLSVSYEEKLEHVTIKIKSNLQDTVKVNSKGIVEVVNIQDMAVLVNKQRNLPETYVPNDLIEPKIPFSFAGKSPKKLMRKEAASAIEQLFAQAQKENITIAGVSAYRSYQSQKIIFNGNSRRQGKDEANLTSAIPGQSEHQTGLAIDISSKRINYALEQNLGETEEGKWLAINAPKYGFIVRYPKGKEKITGYTYEPWHLRYVGIKIAKEISEQGITLEEYFQEQETKY